MATGVWVSTSRLVVVEGGIVALVLVVMIVMVSDDSKLGLNSFHV